ncbi:ATP-binding protein [Jiulongibacter sp. NS-SX5]|uniref:ATP-binding protein n=1 Tax=Jiulongibacter sp. NS-SX5 TaxID=3463854 RepID=UPI0040596A69
MKEIRLLLIEDDEEDFELFQDTLDDIENFKFKTTWISNYKKALETIASEEFDLLVVDYLLGAYSGLELCQKFREMGKITPIILLTGKGDSEVDRQASEIGVNDYLVKRNIKADELERSIRYTIKNHEMVMALKVSQSKYRAFLKNSQDILFIANTDCNLVNVSDSLKTITGFSKKDLNNKGLLELILKEDLKKELLATIADKKSIHKQSATIKCKDGEIKTVELTCLYQEGFNEPDFIHGVIIDKTEEVKMMQSRLVNEKLESTARFMRTLAHEVRNPLSNISLAIEGMEAEEEEVSPYLSIIKRNSGRIDNIITKVLNSSHIETKAFEKINLIESLETVIETVKDKASLKGIEMVVNLPVEPLELNLNEEQFSLAVSNILVNAVEALDQNKDGVIRVTLENGKLYISDNGPGISKEDQGHIFEPYYTRKTNGIGLGLSSTLGILKAHQIELELDSDLGKGATFVLHLPVEVDA